jgi:hypothetical protein
MTTPLRFTGIHLRKPETSLAEPEPDSAIYDSKSDRVREVKATIPEFKRVEIDAKLIAILDASAVYGETVTEQFKRKERELAEVLGTLNAVESLAMHRRLANPQIKDELAEKFARMVVDRRNRLLGFLADCRRRSALQGARRVA